mgnify:CR=1 FL=1
MPIKIGLIGKTNTGKTTFFNSATLSSSEISTYPFTTKKAETATANAITLCVHPEFKVTDNPNNSRSFSIYLCCLDCASSLLVFYRCF